MKKIHPLVLGFVLFGGGLAVLLHLASPEGQAQVDWFDSLFLGSPQVEESKTLNEDVILDPGMGFGMTQAEAEAYVSRDDYGVANNYMMVWWPDLDGDDYGQVSDDLIYATYDDLIKSGRLNWANNCLDEDDTDRDIHPEDPYDGDFGLGCGLSPMLCLLGTVELEEIEIEVCPRHEEWAIYADADGDGCGDPNNILCWDQEFDLPPGYVGNDRDWDDAIHGCVWPGPRVQLPE